VFKLPIRSVLADSWLTFKVKASGGEQDHY